jgi:hypothetical protein
MSPGCVDEGQFVGVAEGAGLMWLKRYHLN